MQPSILCADCRSFRVESWAQTLRFGQGALGKMKSKENRLGIILRASRTNPTCSVTPLSVAGSPHGLVGSFGMFFSVA